MSCLLLIERQQNWDISLIRRGKLFSRCVRSSRVLNPEASRLHRSETWSVRKENEVALHRVEIKMARWTCDVKVKDGVPSKELRETMNRWYNLGTTAKQVAMLRACVAKRRHWLGKEMYWVWSNQEVDQTGLEESLCKKTAKHVNWTDVVLL